MKRESPPQEEDFPCKRPALLKSQCDQGSLRPSLSSVVLPFTESGEAKAHTLSDFYSVSEVPDDSSSESSAILDSRHDSTRISTPPSPGPQPFPQSRVNVSSVCQSHDAWDAIELPHSCVRVFNRQGIKEPYDWQKSCLSSSTLKAGKNLVFTLPTSAGKTFVAEVVLLRRVLSASVRACKLLFIVPFVTLAREKAEALEVRLLHSRYVARR